MPEHADWTPPERGSGRVLFPPLVDAREYLMGLVLKTASDNAHLNVGAILASAGYPHARFFDLALSRLESIEQLAKVLGTDHVAIDGLVFRSVRSVGALTTVSFLGTEASSFDIVTRRRRISGETLRSDPFHRAVWTHGLLPYCPLSLELLVDRCPDCGGRLDWDRATLPGEPQARSRDVNAIFRCGDSVCGKDVRTTSSPTLAGDLTTSYRRMAGLLAPADRHDDGWKKHSDLEGLSSGSCFELGWSLARSFGVDELPRVRCKQLTPEVIVGTLHLAERLLSGWPHCLRETLTNEACDEPTSVVQRRLRRLRNLARTNTAWPDIAYLIRQTYPDLLERGRKTLRSLNPSVVTRTTATSIAGMHTATFARAAMSGGLSALFSSKNLRTFQDFDVAAIEKLRDARENSIPFDAVAERLGISYHGVEQLVVEELLTQEQHPALLAVYQFPRVTRTSLDALIDRISQRSKDEAVDSGIPLRIAVKCLQGEKPWASIFRGMLNGTLHFGLDATVPRVCHGIVVPTSTVDLLRSFVFLRADHPAFKFAEDMSRRDAEEALNLVPRTLQAALDQELGPDRSRGRVKIVDVEGVAQRVISAAEISARTWPGTRRLPCTLRRSRYPRIGAAGWLRTDIEPLIKSRGK